MSKVGAMLNVGQRALANNQTALQTVAHNIANKSTEGYSRQRVDFSATPPSTMGNVQIGTGARVSDVISVKNDYLEKQIQDEGGKLGYNKSKSETLGRVEQVFNEQINKGLNRFVGEFFNAWRELANSPESTATRTQVREAATNMVNDFSRIHKQLKEIQSDVDFRIKSEMDEINGYAKEIANLNEKIDASENGGAHANDLRDRRSTVLKKLGEKINIKYHENSRGQINVIAGDNAIMVSGYSAGSLSFANTPESGEKREGNYDIMYTPSGTNSTFTVTEQIRGGALGGALEVRDLVVNKLLTQLDQSAYNLSMEVNQVHVGGYDRYGREGVLFFEVPKQERDASAYLQVNQTVLRDVGRIVTGSVPNAPGDNRVANQMAQLQSKRFMDGGNTSIDDFYNSMVGEVGVMAKKANSVYEHQNNVVSQLKNLRESISGVSLDEETVKMIEFQKSFDASAKLIKTADEMLATVLELKR